MPGQMGDIQHFQSLHGGSVVFIFRLGSQTQMSSAPQHHIIQHAVAVGLRRGLRYIAHQPRNLAWPHGLHVLPVQQHVPLLRLEQAGDAVEQGGFACAVAAEQREQRAAFDVQVHAVEHGAAAVGVMQVFDIQHGLFGLFLILAWAT